MEGSRYIGYNNELGQLIKDENLHLRQIVKFRKIPVSNFPVFSSANRKDHSKLNNDQDRFYSTCLALIHGDESHINLIKHRKIGKIGHARWHTTIDRICTVYMTTEKPSKDLVILTQFGVKIYGQILFSTKLNPSFANGPRLYWEIANRINEQTPSGRYFFPEIVRNSVIETLTNNSYWAHPENILIAMICDKNQQVQLEGIRLVGVARDNLKKINQIMSPQTRQRGRPRKQTNETVRSFIKPTPNNQFKLNFNANHYSMLVNLENNSFEPPMTVGLKLEELTKFKIPNLSNNSQVVERYVQATCEEALHVSREEDRNANVLITEFYRENVKHQQPEQIKSSIEKIVKYGNKLQKRERNERLNGTFVENKVPTLSLSVEELFLSTSEEDGHNENEIHVDNDELVESDSMDLD